MVEIKEKKVAEQRNKQMIVRTAMIFFVVSLLIMVSFGIGYYIAGQKQNPKTGLTIIDDMGRTVIIEKKPTRIVSLAPSTTETLFTLGLGNKIVGVDDYSDYPSETKQKEKVGAFDKPNVEKILNLTPDLVVAYYGQETAVEQLENARVTVICLHPQIVEDIFRNIRLLGQVTETSSKADVLVKSLENRMNNITAKTSLLNETVRPRVYYEMWCGPYYTAGPGSFVDDLIRMAGGLNIASGTASEWPVLNEEFIISSNPQIIITTYMNMATPTDIKNRTGWNVIDAIKNNRVYQIDGNLLERPGPRLIDGLEMLYDLYKPFHSAGGLSELHETYTPPEENPSQ